MRGEALVRLDAAVPDNVRRVCSTLVSAGFQAVAVGGAVRDAILGRTPGDWDVASSAHPGDVVQLFPQVIETGIQHGTVTIVTGRGKHTHVEVTTFRGEGAYTDARRPDHVRFGVPLIEDLARRDLRVNAMAYDPASKELIDPYGGLADLEQGLLRAVGPTGDVYTDAVARFTEDGLRVMRAVRFAAQLEMALDPDTERGITPALPSLEKVSRERVCEELRKILLAEMPSRALIPAWRSGIIASILPSVVLGFEAWRAASGGAASGGNDQDLTSYAMKWAAAVDRCPRESRLGALIAELAPPGPGFDRAAAKRAGDLLRALKFANDEIGAAQALVGASAATRTVDWTETAVRRLLSEVTRAHAVEAVGMWRGKGAARLAELGSQILARGDALATGDLAIGGEELMALGLKGRAIGDAQKRLLDRVLDDPALNTRDALLELARQSS